MAKIEIYFTELKTQDVDHEFLISKLKFLTLLHQKYNEIIFYLRKLSNYENVNGNIVK